jgi:hypothetical protein
MNTPALNESYAVSNNGKMRAALSKERPKSAPTSMHQTWPKHDAVALTDLLKKQRRFSPNTFDITKCIALASPAFEWTVHVCTRLP